MAEEDGLAMNKFTKCENHVNPPISLSKPMANAPVSNGAYNADAVENHRHQSLPRKVYHGRTQFESPIRHRRRLASNRMENKL